MRYSSTTARTSRGGTVCRSNTSVIGMRSGFFVFVWHSPPTKNPAPQAGPGRKNYVNYRYCAHLTLSDLVRPVLAHDRFHLIFQAEFQFLQPHFLQLFLVCQVGKRFQFVQLVGEL